MKPPLALTVPLIAALALFSATGQTPQWLEQDTGLPGTARGDDIYFINQSTGWLARGTNGIYKTTDGGNTWTQLITSTMVNSGTTSLAHFRSIGFATPTHGWAGNLGPNSYDGYVTDNNVLYETTDGGTTWNPVPSINQSGMKGFCSIFVLDSQHIYGAGRVRGPAFFVKSSDQGATWTTINLTAAGIMGGIMDIYFKDQMNGFVVGMDNNTFAVACGSVYHGAIARTTDGGNTWTVVASTDTMTPPLACCYFWKMAWPSANVGYASLQQNASTMIGHVFYKTMDGGATWTPNIIPFSSIAPGMTAFYWQGIGFVSETEGWAGGSVLSYSGTLPNTFLHTTDGGTSWSPAGFNDSQSINRIRVSDPTLAHASGHKAYVYRIPLGINQPPQNQTVCVGGTATFTVTLFGNPPFTYQWSKNGMPMTGKTDSTLTLNNVTSSDAATYSVTAANTWDSVASSGATLTVLNPVTITSQPQAQTVDSYTTVTLSVSATGDPPITYQWYKNGFPMTGKTAPTLTLNSVTPADAGFYTVVVQNSCGPVTTSGAILKVGSSPTFGISPCPPVIVGWSFGPIGWVRYYVKVPDFQNCILFIPQPIPIGDPYEFEIAAMYVPLEWANSPEIQKVQALLNQAEVDQPQQLYLFPELQKKLKLVDLGINLQAESTNAAVKLVRRAKSGTDFLVRDSADKKIAFDLSGKLPKGTRPGDIFLILITAHSEKARGSHAADAHFTEILEVQAVPGNR